MLAQDYLSWSRQMRGLLQGQRGEWSQKWQAMCEGLDPLAPADENRLADIAAAWTDYLHQCKREGLHFIQPGRFVLPGDMAGAPALQFFRGPMWTKQGKPDWRRRASTRMRVCCASGITTIANRW
jgi:predicted YcjX-like family ATPase